MSKIKVSKNDVKNCYKKILAVGYCDLQYLLKYEDALFYSSGVYGWCCDYYIFEDCIISTGYSPVGDWIDYDLVKKYNNKARELSYSNYEEQKKEVKRLLKKFIKEATKEEAEA